MKKLLKRLLIIFAIVLVIIIGVHVFNFIKQKIELNNLMTGMDGISEKTYMQELEQQESDIKGMTRADKYKKGLDVSDNSDTDMDGLTDKEEIEIYKSNPLLASTAQDLYTDGYKVSKGLDLNTYYEYAGDVVFEHNECEEVQLSAKSPASFNAVIKDITGNDSASGYDIYKAYSIYNFDGTLSIDLSDVINEYGIDAKDIDVLIYSEGSVSNCKYKRQENTFNINEKLEVYSDYKLFFVKSSTLGMINSLFNGDELITSNKSGISGNSLVYGSLIKNVFLGESFTLWYEDLKDTSKTNVFKDRLVSYVNSEWVGETGAGDDYVTLVLPEQESTFKKNSIEITAKYNILKTFLPIFEYRSGQEVKWYHGIFFYGTCSDVELTDSEDSKEVQEEVRENNESELAYSNKFDKYVDELPFQNFGSYISDSGNCAGIAHLTSTLFNTGSAPTSGSYVIDGIGKVTWDISKHTENSTLSNRGLADYLDSSFVKEKGEKNVLANEKLTDYEKEFVNMIGCYLIEANEKIQVSANCVRKGITCYDYSMIENIIAELDKGKILDLSFANSKSGHCVNVYDYYYDANDSDIVWFKIYDNTIPRDSLKSHELYYSDCLLKVWKKPKTIGSGYTFGFEYKPVKGADYCYTNDIGFGKSYAFVVTDENWNIIR